MTIVGGHLPLGLGTRQSEGYLASCGRCRPSYGPLLGGVFSQLGICVGILINIQLCLLRHDVATALTETITRGNGRSIPWGRCGGVGKKSLVLGVLRWRQAGLGICAEHQKHSSQEGCCWSPSSSSTQSRRTIMQLWVSPEGGSVRPPSSRSAVGASDGPDLSRPTYLGGACASDRSLRIALAALTIGWPATAAVDRKVYPAVGFHGDGRDRCDTGSMARQPWRPYGHAPNVAVVAVVVASS